MLYSKFSNEVTFKKVSCWPAKLASSKSSAVADDLTAKCTGASNFSNIFFISNSILYGNLEFIIEFLISFNPFSILS